MTSRLSLWSTDSVLSIGSRGSVLSIGSIGSLASIASVGSIGSVLSVGSALSTGSALARQSQWSLLADRSFGTAMTSRGDASRVVGAPAVLAAIGVGAYAGYLLERARRRSAHPRRRAARAASSGRAALRLRSVADGKACNVTSCSPCGTRVVTRHGAYWSRARAGTDRPDDRRPPTGGAAGAVPGSAAGSQRCEHPRTCADTDVSPHRGDPVADITRRMTTVTTARHIPTTDDHGDQFPGAVPATTMSADRPAGADERLVRMSAAYTEKVNAAVQANRESLAYELAEQTFAEELSAGEAAGDHVAPERRPGGRRTPPRNHGGRPPTTMGRMGRLTRRSLA